jgi:hypothetical protein
MMTAAPTAPAALDLPAAWSLRLQVRIMRLLLQHDQRLFRGQFRQFFTESTLPPVALFEQYDRYLRLLLLSDELLDDIMPRIRRQLSLQTDQTRLREEAPTRGDIDWRRTFERSWHETPGLPPLQFDTRLRQRSTATPENLLAVAVLLRFRRELAHAIRDNLADEQLGEQERQTLVSADERAERELAAAYARALLAEAHGADIDMLATQVATRLRPGPNPYRDLVVWWRRFRDLRFGRVADRQQLSVASRRDDEKTDAWLYELWIALEIIHLLHQRRAIVPNDTHVEPDVLQCCFVWNERRFRMRYNRQHETSADGDIGWEHAPASRPDYTIEREQTLKVAHGGQLIWREPPVVLDAKYYLRGNDPARTHTPIKKVFGDMLLLGAQHGGLFFPLLPEPPQDQAATRIIRRVAQRHHGGMQAAEMRLYHLAPDMPTAQIQARLAAVLDHAAAMLPERPPVACHGVWLDADSINASHSSLPMRRILCPKPHIGADAFDMVSPELHCLRDPRVCHVIGQAIIPPFVVRATTRDELAQQANNVRARSADALRHAEAHDEDHAEQLRGHILAGVGRAVEQYVKLRGNTATIEDMFERWVFGDYWRAHSRSLSQAARTMLISGEYVWQEYQQTPLDDWAAAAIQFCRALEHELKRRMYKAGMTHYKLPKAGWTLGMPLYACMHKDESGQETNALRNWNIMLNLVQKSGADPAAFEQTLARIEHEQVKRYRNTLAHSDKAAQHIAETLRHVIIGNRRQPGVLSWLVENLDPL